MINPIQRIGQSRWGWALRGLPSWARARALFAARRFTMTTPERCRHLWDSCQKVLRSGTPGCFVECGVWKGGSAAVMALALRQAEPRRRLHLFDSFQGLPEPHKVDGDTAITYSHGRSSGALSSIHRCEAGLPEVRNLLLEQLGFTEQQIHFHVGWFQNTVPTDVKGLGPIAVLRLDGDWYESTQVCLKHLYPLLSSGGVVILDDYFCWEGCRKATDEYRATHGVTTPIERVDLDAGCWWKT